MRLALISFLVLAGCQTEPANIAIIENESEIADEAFLREVARAFYADHPDTFDMLVLWGAPGTGPLNSYYHPVKNDVRGIGYQHVGPELFDRSAEFGSTRLQGIIWMAPAWRTNQEPGPRSTLGILAQESGHRWGSSVYFRSEATKDGVSTDLLANPYHWSFFLDTGASPMGGNQWQRIGEDTYLAAPVDFVAFSPLDLYLMGLVGREAVAPLRLLSDIRDESGNPSSAFTRASRRVTRPVTVRARAVEVPLDAIIAVEGPRSPNTGNGARDIRQAWIYVSRGGEVPKPDLEVLAGLQAGWDDFFSQATSGLSRMDSSL